MWLLFQKLPRVVKLMILKNGMLGGIFILIFLGMVVAKEDIWLIILCLFFSIFMIVNGFRIFYNCSKRNYVEVAGTCIRADGKGLKNWSPSFQITFSGIRLRVFIRIGQSLPEPGDWVTIYLGNSVPVYLEEDVYCIYEYYAMEIQRKI